MKSKKSLVFIIIGLLLIVAALGIYLYNLWDEHRVAQATVSVLEQIEINNSEDKYDYTLNPKKEMNTTEINGFEYVGVLEIPSLNLKLPVINQWSYSALRVSPCVYSGSPYTENLVIAAHNYTAHFGALNNMQMGEAVIFTDLDGNVFEYIAETRETLDPDNVAEMKSEEWNLSLFTCTLDGQHRVTLRCKTAVTR